MMPPEGDLASPLEGGPRVAIAPTGDFGMTISRWLAVCGAAMVVALVAAVPAANSVRAEDAPAIERLPDDTTVATVGGKPVTAGEVRVGMQLIPQEYRFILPAEFLMETILQQVIDVHLAAEAAVKAGVDTAAIDLEVAFYRDRLLHQAYLKKRFDAEVTPAVVRQRYDEMMKNHQPEDEIRARHILVKTEEEAKAIAAELAKGGNFEEIAKAKSIDETSKVNGGDLGYFTKGRMVPEFETAAFATEVGKVSAPVQTQFGWHLIRVDDKRKSQPPTFESVVPQIQQELNANVADSAAKELRSGVKIEMNKLDAYAVLGLPKPPPSVEEPAKEGAGEQPKPAEGNSGDSAPATQ